ncbi:MULTISPECIES: ABC transporter permease [Bacillus]|uniref:ABC transporter permease n=1 Tax=Bacillus TaxID=1386 RepID=UPI000412E241|nr:MULTISPECIES: ABC transporter permease [Bacillus]QHZ48538.1 ABC transporter permease subunit [Bacillus sp. NSP9.1]WFA05826.1 ABC transporter permease [Bacillus sp. HSf4]
MFKLIQNEHVKLLKRKVTFVALALTVALQFLLALVTKRILMGAGTDDHFIGYFSFAPNLNILLQVLSIAVAASIISFEYDKKTIKFLLIRPVSREKILISKFLTSVMASIWLYIIYYGFSLLFGLIFFGVKLDEKAGTLFLNTLQLIGSEWLEVLLMVSFAFFCSALFRSSALSIMVSIVVLYGAKALVTIMSYLENPLGKFLLFANTDFTQYAEHAKPLFSGMTPFFSIGIILVHFAFFLGAAWWSFCRRDMKV